MDGSGVDFAFSFYERLRHRQVGRRDRDVRRPDLWRIWAASAGVMPSPSATVLITGSKGKGSTARLTAWGLTLHGAGPVGLLVSPEECSHLDRIRIDNQPIGEGEFDSIVESIRSDLDALQMAAPDNFYLPPTAVFLAVALCWWRANGVRTCVVEGGRGARWDEIGVIPARLGVVTSILPEHLGKLGPTMTDVAADKLSLAATVDQLLCPAELQVWSEGILAPELQNRLRWLPVFRGAAGWYDTAHALASAACGAILGRPVQLPAWAVPSFGQALVLCTPDGSACDCDVLFDGSVLPICLAPRLVGIGRRLPTAVVLGLDDDKDSLGLLALTHAVEASGPVYAVTLSSAIGHVGSTWIDDVQPAVVRLGTLDVVAGASPALASAISDLLRTHRSVVFVGVQTFLRSMRNLLSLPIAGPTLASNWNRLELSN